MLFHLSTYRNLSVLTPRIPENAVPEYEDATTKRVCFSDSIEGCLSALQNPREYYVYVPEEDIEDSVYHPTSDEVKDAKYTHEVWALSEIKVKCIGIVVCEKYDDDMIYEIVKHDDGVSVFYYPYKFIPDMKGELYI